MPQQRPVIITAIVLAFVLSGALWYSLSQPFIGATPTPSPTQVNGEAIATPSQFTFPETVVTSPEPGAPTTPSPATTPVTPAAPTGTGSYILGFGILTILVGGLGLRRILTV